MNATETETFGTYTTVSVAVGEDGYRSITLYTSRGDSIYGRSLSGYWSLTLDEATALGLELIQAAARAPDA